MIIVQAANFVSPSSGGIRTALDALGSGYATAGHHCIQVVPGVQERQRTVGGVTRVELPSRPVPGTGYRLICDRRRLRHLLEQWQPDRVEVSDKSTLRWLGAWARRRGVPALLWTHERLDALAAARRAIPSNRAALDRCNARLARDFCAVVAPSEWAAEEFRRLSVVTTSVVPLGVDLATFHPARRDDRLRSALLGDGEVLVAAAVRLSAEKQPLLLAETIRELSRAGVPAVLAVAGTGPQQTALRRACRGLPVRLLGQLRDRTSVAALLASADVVIAPGPAETFGLAALEALACGTPVIGRRTGAVPELVATAGELAYGHGRSTAGAVTRLQGRADLREAARARAERYPWSTSVNAMLALHGASPGSPAAGRRAVDAHQ